MIAGLVLAAGAGTRFGDGPKQLAELDGRPLLEWSVRAQCDARVLDRVVVVLGAAADRIREVVSFGRAEVVVCEEWRAGQSASLRRGLAAVAGADKVVVTLGDAPLVSAALIERFAAQPAPVRAVYDGRPGHPVVLGPEQIAAIQAVGGDAGARELLRGAPEIEVGHICSGRDVDTREDLEEVRNEARAVL
ncbi:MAG TPA: nucleotidyltransferase family protein [Solirubrobacteraceae bacterium]|nr:nucleotidyltransferase family protein [Solirubrobacteraceae bacterium]